MRLHDALNSSGLSIVSVIERPGPNRRPEHPDRETTHGNLTLVWESAPTRDQVARASAVITSYDPTPTRSERAVAVLADPTVQLAIFDRDHPDPAIRAASVATIAAARKKIDR